MTQAQFEEFWTEIIPSALFDIMPTDKDEHGGRYDETTCKVVGICRTFHNKCR